MRSLLIICCAFVLGAAQVPPAQDDSVPQPDAGGSTEVIDVACTDAPAACTGASLPVPGQAAVGTSGATGGARDGCIGRILTTEGSTASASQEQSDSVPYCQVDSDGDGVTDSVPPPPPTHPEIVALLCADATVPAPRIGHNPREYGITGLHTWLWDQTQPSAVTTSGRIRGYPVSCVLTPTGWLFDTGDPHAERYGHQRSYRATVPGEESESTPVQHFWEVKDTYTLSLAVTWHRTTTAGSDQTSRTTTTDYQVKEVVAGMTSPDS